MGFGVGVSEFSGLRVHGSRVGSQDFGFIWLGLMGALLRQLVGISRNRTSNEMINARRYYVLQKRPPPPNLGHLLSLPPSLHLSRHLLLLLRPSMSLSLSPARPSSLPPSHLLPLFLDSSLLLRARAHPCVLRSVASLLTEFESTYSPGLITNCMTFWKCAHPSSLSRPNDT